MNCDESLLAAFEAGTVDNAGFSHAGHVQVAWMLSQRYPRVEAFEKLVAGIQGIAARAGRPQAFHLTMTRAWFELVAGVENPDEHPELLDKTLLSRYYSVERLVAGRERWLEPDLHPLRLPAPSGACPSPEQLDALAGIPATVMVLAAHRNGTVHATTISSFSRVSRQPALISLCLANGSRILQLVQDAGVFALSILADDQDGLGSHFADAHRPKGREQFDGVAHHLSRYGPVIEQAAGWIGCRLAGVDPWGDHHIVVGEIRFSEMTERRPLLRHDRRW